MRIGIDGSCLSNRRGFGRFAHQILRALLAAGTGHEFVLVIDRPTWDQSAGWDLGDCRPVIVDVSQAPSVAASARGRRSVRDLLAMGRAAARSGLDLLFFPASYSYFPVWKVRRVVVTVFDTLPLAYPELVFPSWSGRLAWRLKERAAVGRADRVVTTSRCSERDLQTWYGLGSHRVRVIPCAPAEVFHPRPNGGESDAVLARYGIDPDWRFLLYVGGFSPHKNLARLIEAFARGAGDRDRLVLVGDLQDVFHTNVAELRTVATTLGLTGRIHWTGFVPDEDLAFLYSRAQALVQPSILEGFGLPPVEAMACGTPVLHSRAGSLPEVIEDAGLTFDPTDVGAMADAIARILRCAELRQELGLRALERSRQFTWSAAAAELLACFDELAPGSSPGRSTHRQPGSSGKLTGNRNSGRDLRTECPV